LKTHSGGGGNQSNPFKLVGSGERRERAKKKTLLLSKVQRAKEENSKREVSRFRESQGIQKASDEEKRLSFIASRRRTDTRSTKKKRAYEKKSASLHEGTKFKEETQLGRAGKKRGKRRRSIPYLERRTPSESEGPMTMLNACE